MKIDLELLFMTWLADEFPDRVFTVEDYTFEHGHNIRLLTFDMETMGHITDWGFIPWIASPPGDYGDWLAADPRFFDIIRDWLVNYAIPKVVDKRLFELRS